mgnify:CR=1 FL=1
MSPSPMRRKLRSWRRRWRLTQVQAAKALGVSLGGLLKWEHATRAPRGLAREALLSKLKQPPP